MTIDLAGYHVSQSGQVYMQIKHLLLIKAKLGTKRIILVLTKSSQQDPDNENYVPVCEEWLIVVNVFQQ